MEPKEKPKDPNDPRQYMAIPSEGRRVLTSIVVLLVIPIAVFWGVLSGTPSVTTTHPIIAIVSILATLAMVFMLMVTRLGYGILNTVGIEEYVDRNVRGYRLACWIGPGPSGRHELLCHAVIAPEDTLRSDEVSSATLVLPLGGWFRTPTVVMPKGQSLTPTLMRGQLRLRDGLLRLGPYPEVLPYGAIAGHLIQIRDRHGDRMTMSVANALEIFDQHTLCVCTDQGSGLRGVVEGYQRATEAMQRERDHEQEAHRNARFMWTSALIAMEQTIHEIAKTSRFVGSIEALRIRLFLLERFRGLVPTPDPKEPQRAKWIGWADEEIASARADLARRDRHRRRPSTGAGA